MLADLRGPPAEALADLGKTDSAEEARLDSLRWARYGFGDNSGELAREQAQITAMLTPQPK